MTSNIVSTWQSLMDSRFNPLRHMNLPARHYCMQVLAWMWSMIFSLSFLSIYHFGYVWLAHLLVIAGVFVTLSVFQRAAKQSAEREFAPRYSAASKTVWLLEREG